MIIQVEASFYPLARADINESVNRFCSIISNKVLERCNKCYEFCN